jgi:hypothetical protein
MMAMADNSKIVFMVFLPLNSPGDRPGAGESTKS